MTDTTNLLLNSQRIKKVYHGMCKDVMKQYSLTRNELDVLLFLANNPSYDTAKDIVTLRGLTKSHVCKSVESLYERGLLTRKPDSRDRRAIRLCLTEAAQAPVKEAQAMQKRFLTLLYRDITAEEQRVMETVFRKISTTLQEALNDDF